MVRATVPPVEEVLYRLFHATLWRWLRWKYRIHVVDRPPRGRKPLVVVSNHVNFWDPFLVSFALQRPVSFVAADGNFRSWWLRVLMTIAGQVPKAKGRTDMESIRRLQDLVRRGRAIAVFPEGQRTWDGEPREILPGIEKLVRLLRAPVVAVQLRGAYRSLPRWATGGRRGALEITFRELAPHELTREGIARGIHVSEDQWQALRKVTYTGRTPAEGLETLLFYCHHCEGWGSLESRGAHLTCRACGATAALTPGGVLRDHRFPTVSAWHREQMAVLRRDLAGAHGPPRSLPCTAREVQVLTGYRTRRLTPHGNAAITLTAHRLEITISPEKRWSIATGDIQGINVQYARQLEFYARGTLWVLRMTHRGDSAYRFEQTISLLQDLYRSS